MRKARTPFIAAVHILLQRDGRVLLLLRQNTGYSDGLYSVPAGHVEAEETIIAAAARELAEETGVVANPAAFELVHIMSRRKLDEPEDRIDFFFQVKKWRGEPENLEPEKCGGLTWVSSSSFSDLPMVAYIKAGIESVTAGERYSWFTEP